jgi:hypothetical protein
LADGNVPFFLVIEPGEKAVYERMGLGEILLLPKNDQGLLFSRNWIRDHSTKAGAKRHWQIDDNVQNLQRWTRGVRVICDPGFALAAVEDFVDLYQNVAVAGLNYDMFARGKTPPFYLNTKVYSVSLVLNSLPCTWRSRYNDDTDLCLQALSLGWCTVGLNAFVAKKIMTGNLGGGNTEDLYQGDGRLKMSRSLERQWPGVVTTNRRFGRPQHIVADAWKKFDTPLKRVADYEERVKANKKLKLKLKLVAVGEVKSPQLRELLRKEG